jgi:hypothetical protein
MQVVYIRGLEKSKVEKLKEIARRNGYPSLNAYLLELLEQVAEEVEVVEYRNKYLDMQDRNIEVLERNTQALKQLYEFIGGE